MTSGGQLERLIREGQILAFEPDLLIYARLGFWHLSSLLIEGCFRLFPLLRRPLHAFFHSGNRGFLAPTVIQPWEVP